MQIERYGNDIIMRQTTEGVAYITISPDEAKWLVDILPFIVEGSLDFAERQARIMRYHSPPQQERKNVDRP